MVVWRPGHGAAAGFGFRTEARKLRWPTDAGNNHSLKSHLRDRSVCLDHSHRSVVHRPDLCAGSGTNLD